MPELARCPDVLPPEIESELHSLAVHWAKHPLRPRIASVAVAHWQEVIRQWSEDASMPLFLRRSQRGIARGEVLLHSSGRELVLTDNSPANWSYMEAYTQQLRTLAEVKDALEEDRVPVAMVVDKQMRDRSKYICCRVQGPTPNVLGWKVCHKEAVGMRGRVPVIDRPLEALKAHFRAFLSPSNLFLVPLPLGGLGEIQHFIRAIQEEENGL